MSLSSSINDWNIIDSDSQSKSNKLDIIIEYLKKNNLENNYLRKLDTITKKVNNYEKNQQIILEKLENIEKYFNINYENSVNSENSENADSSENANNIDRFPETIDTQNIHRLSNNIWRNNITSSSDLGLSYLTTPNLSLKQLKYPLNCEKCKKCEKMKK